MNPDNIQHISAIISTEAELESVISELLEESVARADISVQGSPEQIKKAYGLSFIAPELIQKKVHPPVKEAYLKDDMGWLIGFSFAIPVVICFIVGVFGLADINYTPDVLIFGTLGILIGCFFGFLNARRVKRKYEEKLHEQEKLGGFVLWVTTYNPEQTEQVMGILEKYHSKSIENR